MAPCNCSWSNVRLWRYRTYRWARSRRRCIGLDPATPAVTFPLFSGRRRAFHFFDFFGSRINERRSDWHPLLLCETYLDCLKHQESSDRDRQEPDQFAFHC
jgi:hypothetical protein